MSSAVSASLRAFNPDSSKVSAFIHAAHPYVVEMKTITRQVFALNANPDEGDMGEVARNIFKAKEMTRELVAQYSEFMSIRQQDLEPFALEADKPSLSELVAIQDNLPLVEKKLHAICKIFAGKIGTKASTNS